MKIVSVGGYAIQPVWADGHNTGIYSFDYLQRIADGKIKNGAPGAARRFGGGKVILILTLSNSPSIGAGLLQPLSGFGTVPRPMWDSWASAWFWASTAGRSVGVGWKSLSLDNRRTDEDDQTVLVHGFAFAVKGPAQSWNVAQERHFGELSVGWSETNPPMTSVSPLGISTCVSILRQSNSGTGMVVLALPPPPDTVTPHQRSGWKLPARPSARYCRWRKCAG